MAQPDQKLLSQATMRAVFSATGVAPQRPVFRRAHRWLLAQAPTPLHTGALFDGDSKLGVCGDWSHGCRVEGAALSGLEAAAQILTATS
jgi:renalase